MTTHFAERIAVEIDGDGDAVLMLHGLGGTSNTWAALAPAFTRFKRIRPDLPGSGRSDRAEGPLSIARLTSGTEVTRQAVTKHLHVLAGAGLARGTRHGRERVWELEPAPLHEARRRLDLISSQWDEALARLKAAVEE